MAATIAVLSASGCAPTFGAKAGDLCDAEAEAQGGGRGSSRVVSVDGWDDGDEHADVTGTWDVEVGEDTVDAAGVPVEWRPGYTYAWSCSVDGSTVSSFSFDWGPQEVGPAPVPEPGPPAGGLITAETVEPGPQAPCLVKGNVSIDTGERIYHVPGQAYYDVTVIDEAYGERWFCSEEEAVAAGWRKSRM